MAARAGATFHEAALVALDPSNHSLRCDDGDDLNFDLLSIDTGPVAAIEQLPQIVENALSVHPIEDFVAAWPKLVDRMLGACRRFDQLILGASTTALCSTSMPVWS